MLVSSGESTVLMSSAEPKEGFFAKKLDGLKEAVVTSKGAFVNKRESDNFPNNPNKEITSTSHELKEQLAKESARRD